MVVVVAEEEVVAADFGGGGGCIYEEGSCGQDGEEMEEVHYAKVTENGLQKFITRGHIVDFRAASG